MQRATIRRWLLVLLVALAAASMFPSFGGSSHRSDPPASHSTLAAKHQGTRPAHGAVHAPPLRTRP